MEKGKSVEKELDIVPSCKLEIQRVLGEGGYGVVSEAFHTDWKQTVAYKQLTIPTLSIRDLDNFKKEARIHSSLNHFNIVAFRGIVFESGSNERPAKYGLLMEFMKNGELKDYLQCHDLDWNKKLPLILDVARGMDYLHSRSPPVIHGDLKIQNVLISEDGTAKICDFGFSLLKQSSQSHSVNNTHKGTITHIPPEYWKDHRLRKVEHFDVYGFGILMWEVMTERTPFKEAQNNPSLIMVWVCDQNSRPDISAIPLDVPVESIDIMKKCWGIAPERPSFPQIKDMLMQEVNLIESRRGYSRVQIEIKEETGGVAGVAWLDNKIYVICFHSKKIYIFADVNPYPQEDELQLEGVHSCYDIIASKEHSCLFVSDCDFQTLWKILMPGKKVLECTLTGTPSRLSVTLKGDLAVVVERREHFHLDLYRVQSFKLRNRIKFPAEVESIQHVVQKSNLNYIVLWFGSVSFKISEMSVAERTGTLLQTFDLSVLPAPLDPNHLAIDDNDDIIVADLSGSRVFVLNSRLTQHQVLLTPDQIVQPRRLCYRSDTREVIVGQSPWSSSTRPPSCVTIFNLRPSD